MSKKPHHHPTGHKHPNRGVHETGAPVMGSRPAHIHQQHHPKHPKKPRHPRHPRHPKHPRKPVKAMAPEITGSWILAGNDIADTCAIAAIANSLLWATGTRAGDLELAMYDEGLSVEAAIEAVAARGLAGRQLHEALPDALVHPGIIIETTVSTEPHALLYLGGYMTATWGGMAWLTGRIEAAWHLEWR